MAKADIQYRLENLRAFHNTPSFHTFEGSLNGDLGRLPREWQDRYRADANRPDGRIVYTVMSYQTPIAWVVLGEHGIPLDLVIPAVVYSNTTCKYQTYC